MTLRWALALAALAAVVGAGAAHAQEPPPTAPAPIPPPALVPDGVTIAGVAVGGMTAQQATATVQSAFARPFTFTFRTRTWQVSVRRLGARADVPTAVAQALVALPLQAVPLPVAVDQTKLRRFVIRLDRKLSRPARDSIAVLRKLRPIITKPRDGWSVMRVDMRVLIRNALFAHERGPLEVRTRVVRPKITRANFGPVIVIRRESRRLYLYRGTRLWRTFAVGVGMARYPTPIGRASIVVKERNPWWNPPASDWAAGLAAVPPGPGNPLGTRWMGLSFPAVGIHGTPDAASVGYSVSHGCIRMRISEAEWVFNRVRVGTPVFIVRA